MPKMVTRLALLLCLLAVGLPAIAQTTQTRVIPKGSVTVPAGQTTADVKVVINGDTAVEPDEPYTVTISSSTLQIGTATATGTIINDDGIVAPVLSVTAPARVKNGTVANFTVSRSGDKSKADKVRWAVVPLGATPAAEDDFPAVLEDEFSGSSLGSEWCAADGSIADYEAPDGCPGIPEDAQLGTWDADRVSVTGGNLRLSIDHDTGTWTSSQVFSKRAFRGGLLKYAITYPAGKGGAHSVWRAPEDGYYGPGPRSGQIVDSFYLGKTSGDRNKTWLSQLQYSGPDSDAFPAIAGLLNDGTTWSGSSRAASTRWRVGTDGVTRFAFQVGNTEYWAPVQGDWPATQPWTLQGTDDLGNPETIEYPGGGAASPFDRPFRLVLQASIGDADSPACTGEESCPDTTTLDGAAALFDYVRYYQYPTGEAVIQPGQDQILIPVQTRDASVAGVRNLRFVMLDADEATISAANGAADVALDPAGTVGVNHGKETYFLDFGSGAGGFTDSFGTTWENGNSFVTGGTAKNDVVTVPGGGTAVGGWTTALEAPPEMVDPLIVTNKCPGETGWPTGAQAAGKDVKIVLPTDRDCTLVKDPQPNKTNNVSPLTFIQGTESNPARNVWLVGGKIVAPSPFPQTNPNTAGWPNGMTARFVKGTIFWEGADIDMRCTCRDAFAAANLGESGARGVVAADKTPRVVFQNSILQRPLQCDGKEGNNGAVHGDIIHLQGTGARPNLKLQNVLYIHGFQGVFVSNGSWQPAGHGASKIEFDHVSVRKVPSSCSRIPNPGDNASIVWDAAPRDGVWFNQTYFNTSGATTFPAQSGFTSAGCATYPASAGVRTGGWCKGAPPKGDPVTPATVGRNYSRNYFLGTGGGSTEPPEIAGARVPRLDHTRLTGSSMAIAVPVNTLRGKQRYVTLGFSARDETAAGQRVFSIAGNVVRNSFDIYANAGARDTETRITVPVTVGDDGFLRLTLTGVTGDAQINWMSIQRPTVSVTLDKTLYNEGDTVTATLRRSGPTEPSVSMGWQVLGAGDAPTTGADFDPQSPSGTAFWNAGDVDKLVTLKARADSVGEPQEGFVFAISGGVGADVDPALSSVRADIAASSGPGDPCAPGGALFPCDTGGGGDGGEPPVDVCRPVGALTGKPINIEAGKAAAVRKTHLVSGMRGIVKGLQTKCAKSTVCYGRDSCLDPKGLQADVPSTAFVRIDTAGAFPDLQPGKRALDSFVYTVCATPSSCTPVIARIVVSAPGAIPPPPPSPEQDNEPPTTPSALTATVVSTSQINLAWGASTDNVGIANYRVLRCRDAGCTPTATASSPTSTTYSSIGLSPAVTYGFRLVAVDTSGNVSPPTSTVFQTTNADPPPPAYDGIRADMIPFVQPSRATLQGSSAKVLAHWHQFPVSRSKPGPDGDWYSSAANLRLRPLTRPARTTAGDVEWRIEDAMAEIRWAREAGIDGFLLNIYRHDMTNPWAWPHLPRMLTAAGRDAKGFKVAPNFDCTYGGDSAEGTAMANQYVDFLVANGKSADTNLMKIGDNYLVGTYWANNCDPAHYASFKARMAERDMPVYLLCTMQGGPHYVAGHDAVCDAWSDWGERTADKANLNWATRFAGVSGEPIAGVISHGDVRYPTEGDWWTAEQRGFGSLRTSWDSARTTGASWVQLHTWNDIGEHSHMYPTTTGQWAFYDLNAYYIAWFKTGVQPTVNKDAIYYSHRIAQTPVGTKMGIRHLPWHNEIDVTAFLTAPATVEVITSSGTTSQNLGAGLQTMKAPLPTSGKPRILVIRNGQVVVNTESAFTVGAMPAEHDVIYRAGGSLRTAYGATNPAATVCTTGTPDDCLMAPGEPVWRKE